MLVKKGGDTRRYSDALKKDKCVFVVERTIAEFRVQHGIGGQALTDYVIRALREKINEEDDCGDPYHPLEGDKNVEWLDGGDASEDEDGDSDLSDE